MKKFNERSFYKINQNTFFVKTINSSKVIRSYVHLCPNDILQTAKLYNQSSFVPSKKISSSSDVN